MTRGRLALGCAGLVLFAVVAVAWVTYGLVARDAVVGPTEAGARLATITALTPPEDYHPQFAMTLRGMTTVTLVPDFGRADPEEAMVFTVMQVDGASPDAAAARDRLAAEMSDTAGGRSAELAEVARRPVVVRGRDAALVIYEGPRGDGTPLRKAVVAFEGDGGPALLVAAGPVAAWDDDALDALVASLRPGG